MKTLEEIKNEVALEEGKKYEGWVDIGLLSFKGNKGMYTISADRLINEIAKRYAIEAVKSDRERITNAKIHICEIDDITKPMLEDHQKEIILNLPIGLP